MKIVKEENGCNDVLMSGMFKGKKITLMGLGLLGRGIGDAAFLASEGAELIVTDLKSEDELRPSLEKLKAFPNIVYHLGGHQMEDFENRDMILKANNAPLDSPYIAHARAKKIPIEMDAALFVKLAMKVTPITTVGITGTRGKSTVTHLIYEMAKTAGKNPRLGGNERDTATLPLIKEIKKGDLVILELDSWQLQGFEEDKISPHIAVWTNFMPDHMNYYKGDMERYFQDKAAIARFQTIGDYFITTPDIKDEVESRFGGLASAYLTDATIPADWEIALPGDHNRRNATFAAAAARILRIPEDVIKSVLKTFKGLPFRLEFLGEKNGIQFYNDSNSTTPDATIAALEALSAKGKPIVLIAGGNDKGLLFDGLADIIGKTVKSLVLFDGAATEKLQPLVPASIPVKRVTNMDEAFASALAVAQPGDTVILSPAATSFGIFKNEYDRGEQFTARFASLK